MSSLQTALIHGDCLGFLQMLDDNSVDIVIGSPPYAQQRSYGIDFNLKGQAWVDWAVEIYIECLRVSKGLVVWVVEGTGQQTVDYTCEPILMQADLHRRGIKMWKPSIYGRYSLPGRFSVLRNNWEFCIMSSNGRKLPFADPTACSSPPKCKPGGKTRPRKQDGTRNIATQEYKQPPLTNYGNIVWCGAVGGGNMGSKLASENEAPYPEFLVEFFLRSFCPPGGVVLDPFCGSGTSLAVAKRLGMGVVGVEIRESQIDLTKRRLQEVVEDKKETQ